LFQFSTTPKFGLLDQHKVLGLELCHQLL